MQLPNTKAITIYKQVQDILIRCCLPLSKCKGKAFDGASNMSGVRNGVQALVKQEENKALALLSTQPEFIPTRCF